MARSRRLWLLGQWIFAAAVIWYAAQSLSGHWAEVGARLREIRVGWGHIAAASALVLLSYAILMEAWRRLLGSWSTLLSPGQAARIWLASNLGKYVPGKIWSMLAMGAMARESGASAVAAGASSVVMQLLSVLAGIGVAVVLGTSTREAVLAVLLGLVLLVAMTLLAPAILPRMFALASSLTGRQLPAPAIPRRAVVLATVTTIVSWLLTGFAFQLFCRALGMDVGRSAAYIAVYSASYVAGFVALFAPGGIGVREGALVATMQRAGLAAPAEAAVIAVASRIWLTLLEVLPGLIALAIRRGGAEAGRAPRTNA